MKKFLIALLMAAFPFWAQADAKSEKLKSLMEAQGLLSMFEEQLAMGEEQSKVYGQQMLDQFMAQMNPNEEFQKRFSSAFNNFMSKISTPWGAEEIVAVWSDYYGKHFTEKELEELYNFYTSELGKKEVSASKSALTEFAVHFQKLGEPIFQKATQEYIQELKIVAAECKCRK